MNALAYDAHGRRDETINGPRSGFSGGVIETNLLWFRLGERFYVPLLRQFISPDAASPFEAGGHIEIHSGEDAIRQAIPARQSPGEKT